MGLDKRYETEELTIPVFPKKTVLINGEEYIFRRPNGGQRQNLFKFLEQKSGVKLTSGKEPQLSAEDAMEYNVKVIENVLIKAPFEINEENLLKQDPLILDHLTKISANIIADASLKVEDQKN